MHRVEQAVTDADFDYWTVLRPAFFMANFMEPKILLGYTEIRDENAWTNCMTPSTKIGLVDHVDIGRFATLAFQNPQAFHRRIMGITSEELLIQETLDQLTEAIGDGRSMQAIFMTDDEIAKSQGENPWVFFAAEPIVRYMSGYVDMDELHRLAPGLTTLKRFLQREIEAVKRTYGVKAEHSAN
ncbi:hypothetical protein HJFPF1_10279 [Paramyrothecium foliicola]|nr:hypothetical protein HJFPF1_10279 [Paramyrothecium foliicola]